MSAALPPGQLLFWLVLAVGCQLLVAWFGVSSRWLQTVTAPPIPALRLLLIVSLMALGFLLLLDALWLAGAWLRCLWQQRQQHEQQQQRRQEQQQQQALQADVEAGSKPPSAASSDGKPDPSQEDTAAAVAAAAEGEEAVAAAAAAAAAQAAEAAEEALQRPDVPGLRRGLSRKIGGRLAGFEARHPLAFRRLVALVTAACMATAGGCQLVAPGFVDSAIVQLVNSFGVILVVLIQALLLGHRLPLLVWPCAFLMTGGAIMVVLPAANDSSSGGLTSGRAWLGFGLSVLTCLAATLMYILLQAFRRLRFTARGLQYAYLSLTVAVALPLTLGVDGTAWGPQFAGWTGGDWALLVTGATVVYVGQNMLIQHTTWKLGAPLVSMLYGLRLVASIGEQRAALGYTVIQSGVQIAGATLAVASVTVYAGWQYWRSRRAAAAGASAASLASRSSGGGGK